MFRMSLSMEIMIMVALMMYVLTGIVGMVILAWYGKIFGPFIKIMMKHMNKMYSEMEEAEAEQQEIE
jgi:integral membrane sensor domain MASE1